MGATMPSSGPLRYQSALLLTLVIAVTAVFAAGPVWAQQENGLQWSVTINGRSVDDFDTNDPLRLVPEEGALLEVELSNTAQSPRNIRSVRLDGQVMGLTMYNYTTRVDIEIPPGSTTTRRVELDLLDLSGQAVGLIPSRIQLLDDERNVLLEESFPADIRGSVTSVYGVFALAIVGISVVLLGVLLLAIRRNQLPRNRWKRAMHYVPLGVGIGFVLTFTLSATRQLAPNAGSWVSFVLICGGVAFAVGYFLSVGAVGSDTEDSELGSPGASNTSDGQSHESGRLE